MVVWEATNEQEGAVSNPPFFKAAGLETAALCVLWNYHERRIESFTVVAKDAAQKSRQNCLYRRKLRNAFASWRK
jgi:hypothetical protein